MGRNRVLWLCALVVMLTMGNYGCKAQINRDSFPKGFTFGTASSAFQYEGAVKEDGRGATVWDTFSHKFGKIIDGSNADVAVDQYHLYNDDVQLMKDMGLDAYRFSIAWSRIFPNGSGEINQAGVDYYNKLIDALLAKGIEPYVTLFHWDLPQALEDQYKGWLDPQIIKDFANYAETCFQKFGDRVKHWITFNEPHTLAIQGYDAGLHAPGRCSIAWSRIFPNGSGEINQAGVDHYNKLIDALLAKGIEPYITLFHWDLPQALEDQYKGWLDPQIIKDFANYAETCFQKFGDRVKNWITFNEPHTLTIQGYNLGLQAPGRCSIVLHLFCKEGNSSTEPYIVAHNMLLSHATVADIYRTKYKSKQEGQVGVAFDVMWYVPGTNSTNDIEAAQRAQDFQLGWFIEPLIFGTYPSSMVSRVGDRLPKFSAPESALLKNSLDFVGINHYTTYYAYENKTKAIGTIFHDVLADSGAITLPFKGFTAIGDRAGSIWLYIVPTGLRSLMNYIRTKYGNPPVIITENGMDDTNDALKPIKEALKDEKRIKYHNDYLTNLLAAIKEDGCNVKGYFVWSLLDNFEWTAGYTSRFGLYFVDYKDKLKRYPKASVQWFKKFLAP